MNTEPWLITDSQKNCIKYNTARIVGYKTDSDFSDVLECIKQGGEWVKSRLITTGVRTNKTFILFAFNSDDPDVTVESVSIYPHLVTCVATVLPIELWDECVAEEEELWVELDRDVLHAWFMLEVMGNKPEEILPSL